MQNRRKFIRNSLLTVSGAGLISGSFPQPQAINESTDKESKFIYRTLGRTGIRLPVISMGTAYNNNPNLVRQAMDKGVRLFATAEAYTNGNNQIMLGNAIKDRPRDSFVILTSVGELHHYEQEDGRFKTDTDHTLRSCAFLYDRAVPLWPNRAAAIGLNRGGQAPGH